MNRKRLHWKGIVDVAMFLLLLNQMAYVLTGQRIHEYSGTIMVCFILCHNLLNGRWFGALRKGIYSPRRLFGTGLNFITIALICGLFFSGVVMSRYVFDFLPVHGGRALARRIHISCAYWGFFLMEVHIGMHWKGIKGRIGNNLGRPAMKGKRTIAVIGWAVSVYGLYAFCRHEIVSFLFLQNEFAIFNGQSIPAFILDYLAMTVLIVYLTDGLNGMKGRGHRT